MTPVSPKQPGLIGLCAWAWTYASRRSGALSATVATMLLKTAFDVLKPWPMVFLVDYVLQNKPAPSWMDKVVRTLPGNLNPAHLIGWCVGATVLLFLLSWSSELANTYANVSLGQRMVYDLASDLFAKLQGLSLRFHASKSVGDNIRRATTDCACVSVIVNNAALPVAGSVIGIAVMFGVLWRTDAKLTLLALAVVPLLVVVLYLYAGAMTKLSYAQQQEESRIYQIAEQTFSAMPAVQAFSREAWNDRAFAEACAKTTSATVVLTHVQLRFKALIGLAMALGTAAILWFGGWQALRGATSLGAILLFLSYLASLYEPLATVMYTSATLQTAVGSAQRVREILDADREISEKPNAVGLTTAQGRVQIENVTFGYERDRPVLRQVSLELQPGEIVALVGLTGAGKSTLAALIPRFIDPWEGRVLVDGRDARNVQLTSLRQQIGLVLQEPFLFPISVAENIAYGRRGAAMLDIEAAARAAHAYEFIQRLPQGFHTIIGERGATLSGGERQRLSLARALLKNAPILILDEPSSALDTESETAIVEALHRFAQNRSVLIIAHRLSTIRRATRIVALQDGLITESGTHDELLRRGGVYAAFYQLQQPISE
jgi:ATP-binding cassette subfamily B protein/subfamily B ATP-binding cassette protein MsbA